MTYPDTTVEIAKHAFGPKLWPLDRGYLYSDSNEGARNAFGTGSSLNLQGDWRVTFEAQVEYIDQAGPDRDFFLARIDNGSTTEWAAGFTVAGGSAPGARAGRMWIYDGTTYHTSDLVDELVASPLQVGGLPATPTHMYFDYRHSTTGTDAVRFYSAVFAGTDPADIQSGVTYEARGSANLPARSSGAGNFVLLPNNNSNDIKLVRNELPGGIETNWDDHDGAGTFNDGTITWTVDGSPQRWRASDWVDVTDLVLYDKGGVTYTRGRGADLSPYSPGTANFVLDNTAREWDSAGDPTVRPLLQVRIRASFDSTTYDLWFGYVRSLQPFFDGAGLHPMVRVGCIDAFALFAADNLGGNYTQAALALGPIGQWPLQESALADEVFANSVFGGIDIGIDAATLSSSSVFVGRAHKGQLGDGSVVDDTTNPQTDITGDLTVAAWVGLSSDLGSFTGQRWNILAANGSGMYWGFFLEVTSDEYIQPGFAYRGSVSDSFLAPAIAPSLSAPTASTGDHVAVTVSSTQVLIYVNGEQLGGGSTTFRSDPGGTPTLVVGGAVGSLDDFPTLLASVGLWDWALSAEEIRSLASNGVDRFEAGASEIRLSRVLDAAGWPSWARTIEPAQVTLAEVDAAGPALATMQQIELAEFGDLFIASNGYVRFLDRDYRDDHSTATAATFDAPSSGLAFSDIVLSEDDETIINDARLVGTNGTARASNLDSIRLYGRRTFERTVPTEVDDAQAQAIVDRFATPTLRPRQMTIRPTREPADLFPEVLSLDLTDKVSITIPTLGSDPTVTARIARISQTFNGQDWTTVYGLEVEPA